MRTRLTLLAVLVTAVAVPLAANAKPALSSSRPDACTLAGTFAAGDDSFYLTGAGEDADLDIVSGKVQVTSTDLVATIGIAKLGDGPTAYWGDEFDVTFNDQVTGGRIDAGYWRTRSGGGAVLTSPQFPASGSAQNALADNAYPAQPTTMGVAFNKTASTVRLTLPIKDVEAGFGKPLSALRLSTFSFSSFSRDPAYFAYQADYAELGADPNVIVGRTCAAYRAKHPSPRPALTPCQALLVDNLSDEDARLGTTTPVRSDDVDLSRLSFNLTRTSLVASLRVARLGDRPVDATGDDFGVLLSYRDKSVEIEAVRDVTGVTYAATGGVAITPTAVFDKTASTVTLTISRADVARVLGVGSLNGVTLSKVSAATHWSLGPGGTTGIADGTDGNGGVIQVPTCDRYLATHH